MSRIDSDDIIDLSRQLQLPQNVTSKLLATHVYNDADSWKKFLKIFFITLSVGLFSAGVIMFFAYNWTYIHKFAKLALLEGLVCICVLLVLVTKFNTGIKNLLITGATVFAGGLFAVFGQIYQTGANAYDFFLGWTIAVSLWVLVAGFAPLWLIYIALINTTIVLYFAQVAPQRSAVTLFSLLFTVNLCCLVILTWLDKQSRLSLPSWFFTILAIGTVCCSTFGISAGIFDGSGVELPILVIATLLIYACAVFYALKAKRALYLSLVAFSLVFIVATLILSNASDVGAFFSAFLFVVIAITATIKMLINLNKKWAGE
jgi:uncharacterized membrane protein